MNSLMQLFGGESEHNPPQYSVQDVERAKAASPKAGSATGAMPAADGTEGPSGGFVSEKKIFFEEADRESDPTSPASGGKHANPLLNRGIVAGADLRTGSAMNLAETPSPKHAQLQMVFQHKDGKRIENIEKKTGTRSGDHEGHSTFGLFVRKMHRGMHFLRVGGDGARTHTNVLMKANNQGVKYFAGLITSGRRVDLQFKHLTKVVDLERPLWLDDGDDDPSNDLPPEQRSVQTLLGGDVNDKSNLVPRAFLLVFQDGEDDGDELTERDLASLPEKYATATALLRFAKIALRETPSREVSMFSKVLSGVPSGSVDGGGDDLSPSSTLFRTLEGLEESLNIGAKIRAGQLAAEERALAKRDEGKSAEEVAKQHEKYVNRLAGLVNGGTVEANGMDVVLLIANSREGKHLAVNGFKMAADFAQEHKDTAPDLQVKKAHPEWLKKLEKKHAWLPGVLKGYTDASAWVAHLASFFHALYRPHHQPNHPPPRFHAGVEAEVLYDDSFRISVEFDADPVESAQRTKANRRSSFASFKVGGKGSGGNEDGEEEEVPKVTHDMCLPCPVFKPGMFLKARVTDFEPETSCYSLEYVSGPYLSTETPDPTSAKNRHGTANKAMSVKGHPEAVFTVHNVKGAFLSVDMADNYGSHFPTFLFAISAVQMFCFFYYALNVSEQELTATSPVAGPLEWWMQVVGDFPNCADLRPEWWRLWSYQLVHQGSSHIGYNIVMQVLFGLPINMVHGNVRFFCMYELGVVGGSLCWVLIGGGQSSLVGCSGGVYAIFGIHVAELIMNWDSNKKGLMNHWTRLFIMATILGLDFYLYLTGPSHTTSYTAHVGGFLMGAAMGIVFLQNLEVTWAEANVIVPGAYLITAVILVWACTHYAVYWPPEAAMWPVENDNCCVQLIDCDKLGRQDYSLFSCSHSVDVTKRTDGFGVLDTCSDFLAYKEFMSIGTA